MSFEFSLNERDKASAKFMTKVHRALMREMIRTAKEKKMTRSDIARLLEIDRSAVSRALNGKSNLTIRTVSDLCWAMGVEPHFDAREAFTREGCNHSDRRKERGFVSSVKPNLSGEGLERSRSSTSSSETQTKFVMDNYGT